MGKAGDTTSITTDTTSNWGILQGHTRSTWAIDPAATRIGFGVRNLMARTVRGSLADAEGTIILDEADRCMCRVEIAIPATSIDIGNSRRDKYLRSSDLLDVERFPTILFHSTRVATFDETHARIIGQLTIRDTAREVVLRVAQEAGGGRWMGGRQHALRRRPVLIGATTVPAGGRGADRQHTGSAAGHPRHAAIGIGGAEGECGTIQTAPHHKFSPDDRRTRYATDTRSLADWDKARIAPRARIRAGLTVTE